MADSRKNGPTRKQIHPRVKVWLETVGQETDARENDVRKRGGQYVFGLGISDILKAVESSGSIKAAAELLGKSYRHVWSRIKEAEEALGQPLVDARRGGSGTSRSSLTELASQLVADYDALRRRMFEVVEEEFSARFETLSRPNTPHSTHNSNPPG